MNRLSVIMLIVWSISFVLTITIATGILTFFILKPTDFDSILILIFYKKILDRSNIILDYKKYT